jgi:hypothetical protein
MPKKVRMDKAFGDILADSYNFLAIRYNAAP